jgi:uncharacterized protein
MSKYNVTPPARGATQDPLVFGVLEEKPQDLVKLGRLNEQGPLRDVFMDVTTECVVAIFGKRGSGKSYTLGALAEGLCTHEKTTDIGRCSGHKAALLLDTLNIFWSTENPLITGADAKRFPSEMERLSSWGIRPPALNVSVWIPRGAREPHTPKNYLDFGIPPSSLSADDLADLVEVDAQTDLMGQLLTEVREKAVALNPAFKFEDLLEVLETDEELAEYYAKPTVRGARQRLRVLSRSPIFADPKGTSLAQLLKPGHLSVLELGGIPNSLRAVITSVLLRQIQTHRAAAADAEKQLSLNNRLSAGERSALLGFLESAIPPSWVLVDEAQNILPSNRDVKSSDAVVRFVREGRNFGLSFALTTQQPSAVDQKILAQADTVICHKLTVAQDIARMRDNLKSAEPSEVKLGGLKLDLSAWLRDLSPGTAIVTNTDYDRVFAIEIRPRVAPHGGTGFRFRPEA